MKKAGIILAALVLIAGMVYSAYAVDAFVSVQVRPKPKITIETDTGLVNFGDIDPGTPIETSSAVTVRVKSNKSFDLSYSATDFSSGSNSFAVSNMEYRKSGGSYVAFGNGPVLLEDSMPRGVRTVTYDYRLTVPWDVPPEATYTAVITYTAVQE